MTIYTHQTIHLADDEWSTNLMQMIAEEAIGAWRGYGELVVEVWEHGGWHLTFAAINGVVECVSSANDCATFSKKIKQFWSEFNTADKAKLVRWGPAIRREKKVKVAA